MTRREDIPRLSFVCFRPTASPISSIPIILLKIQTTEDVNPAQIKLQSSWQLNSIPARYSNYNFFACKS